MRTTTILWWAAGFMWLTCVMQAILLLDKLGYIHMATWFR